MKKRTTVLALGVLGALAAAALIAMAVLYPGGYHDHKAYEAALEVEDNAGTDYEVATRAYEAYLSKHPEGHFRASAVRKVQVELPGRIEDREWLRAQRLNTQEAYEAHLERFPDGKWRQKAQQELWVMRDMAAEFEEGRAFYLLQPAPERLEPDAMGGAFAYVRNPSLAGPPPQVALAVGVPVEAIPATGMLPRTSSGAVSHFFISDADGRVVHEWFPHDGWGLMVRYEWGKRVDVTRGSITYAVEDPDWRRRPLRGKPIELSLCEQVETGDGVRMRPVSNTLKVHWVAQ